MTGTRADARKRREDRTTWGSEHEDADRVEAMKVVGDLGPLAARAAR